MIAVTGLRSGTSLMMQTLKLLGVPIVGIPFHEHFSHKELNPKGYYDMPIEYTANGINNHRHRGRAIKLYGHQLSKTDPKYVSKLIICERNYDDTVKSVLKLLEADSKLHDLEPSIENAELLHFVNRDLVERCAKHIKHIRIDYDYMVKNPVSSILKICNFLNIQAAHYEAVKNVTR